MADWRLCRRCSMSSGGLPGCGLQSRESSRAARWRTDVWTLRRPRRSPTWSTPRPRLSVGRRSVRLGGGLGELYETWRSELIRSAAWIEATIDFPDEEIPADALDASRQAIAAIATEMQSHLNDGRRGEILRDGFHVAVIGRAECGQELAGQCVGPARRRHRVRHTRHHSRRAGGPAEPQGLSGHPVRHCRTAGRPGPDRARRASGGPKHAPRRPIFGFSFSTEWPSGSRRPERRRRDLEQGGPQEGWARVGALGLRQTGEGLAELVDLLAKHAEAPDGRRVRLRPYRGPGIGWRLRRQSAICRTRLGASASELAAEHLRLALRRSAASPGASIWTSCSTWSSGISAWASEFCFT